MNEYCCAEIVECYCYHRDVQDLELDGKTPHERRDEEQVSCPSILFGAKVESHPIPAKNPARLHPFGKKVLPCLFVGYDLHAGEAGKETHS